MHQPAIPHLAAADPELARLDRGRGAAPARQAPADRVGELRLDRRARGDRHGADQQVLRGLRRASATTRASSSSTRSRRSRSSGRRRCSASTTRTCSPTRARPPTSPSTWRSLKPGRHRDGHGAADGRPPDARLDGVRHRQVVPRGAVRRRARTPAGSTWTRSASWRCAERPKLIFCGGTAIPRTIDFPAFAEIAREVGAVLVADIAHIAGLIAGGAHPSPVGHADVISTTTHKTLRGPRGAMLMSDAEHAKAHRQGGLPRPAGRPAQPHHRRHRGRAARGGAAVVPRRTRTDRGQRRRRSPTRCRRAASTWSPAAPTTT